MLEGVPQQQLNFSQFWKLFIYQKMFIVDDKLYILHQTMSFPRLQRKVIQRHFTSILTFQKVLQIKTKACLAWSHISLFHTVQISDLRSLLITSRNQTVKKDLIGGSTIGSSGVTFMFIIRLTNSLRISFSLGNWAWIMIANSVRWYIFWCLGNNQTIWRNLAITVQEAFSMLRGFKI